MRDSALKLVKLFADVAVQKSRRRAHARQRFETQPIRAPANPVRSRRRAHARQRFETLLDPDSLSPCDFVGEELMRDSALKLAP